MVLAGQGERKQAMRDNHYLPEARSHWSWRPEDKGSPERKRLARLEKSRKQVNTALGACIAAVVLGKTPGEVLAEATGKAERRARVRMLCEL
jgi:hypothetical protein